MNLLKRLEEALLALERSAIVLILTVMILLAFLQVILRNFFSVGFLWADPLLRHAVLWVGFIGASIATRQEKHINIDLVTRYTSPRLTNLLRILTNLFAALVTGLLAKAGWVFLESERLTADTLLTIGSASLPAWWFQVIIPVGFGLISFRFLLKAADHVVRSFRHEETQEPNLHVPSLEP